jgi:hypothetical protein
LLGVGIPLGLSDRAKSSLQSLLQDSKKESDLLGESLILWRKALIDATEGDWESVYQNLRAVPAIGSNPSIGQVDEQDWQKIALLSGQRQQAYEDMVDLCLKLPTFIKFDNYATL